MTRFVRLGFPVDAMVVSTFVRHSLTVEARIRMVGIPNSTNCVIGGFWSIPGFLRYPLAPHQSHPHSITRTGTRRTLRLPHSAAQGESRQRLRVRSSLTPGHRFVLVFALHYAP